MKLLLQNERSPEDLSPLGQVSPHPTPLSDSPPNSPPNDLLQPLRSLENPSLIASTHAVSVAGLRHEISKFLVLGKRAGGTPIRVSLFGGLDSGRIETVAAAAKLLTLFTLSPLMAQDYAVFGYPCVDPAGFAQSDATATAYAPLHVRWSASPQTPEAGFLRSELQRVTPNGILILRSTEESSHLRANVNSRVIAHEVVRPALLRLRHLVSVEETPVTVFPTDPLSRQQQYQEGRLMPSPDTQPWPFEIEILAPAVASLEIRVQVLVLAALDILRTYRAFSSLGGEL